MTLFIGRNIFAQSDKAKIQNNDNFYFYYGIAGLGSNLGSFQPTLKVHNNSFRYTKEQNSYLGERNRKKKFISKGILRQNSVDSILSIVRGLKDTMIYKTNPCIMSGAVIYIIVACGADTTKFTLDNTFDTTALKIIDILNPYLPKDKKLDGSIEDIKKEEDCWKYLHNEWNKAYKDSINHKQ